MTHILQELSFYLSYPFVRYALIVGVLIALCSSLLGVTLVLKRFSFIGDGLSHVAFGAMAVATIFKLVNNTIFIMPVTIAAPSNWTEYKDKGGCRNRNAFGKLTGSRLSCHEPLFYLCKCIGGCLFNLIWFDNNSYINKNRSFYLYNYVDTSCCIFYFIL